MSPSIINPPTPPKPADCEYRLGLKPGFERAVIEEKYLALKPCLHGCDAHSIDRIGKPDQNRYCWIKGDLSFESIPQSVIEPEERVWIGDAPPKALGDSTVIDKIRPHGMPWLQNDSIALNGGLVAVIGARGSGKTALVDMIAAGAQAPPDSSGQLLVSQTGHRSSRGFGFVWMSQARFRSGWNGFPRHTSANENLVSSDGVYHQSEKWGKRSGLQRVLGLGSYRTAWLMLHKLRQAMVRPGREKLSALVEVDETYWGSAEFGGATGRKTLSKVLIIVAAEADGKRIGRIRMALIEDFDRKTLPASFKTN